LGEWGASSSAEQLGGAVLGSGELLLGKLTGRLAVAAVVRAEQLAAMLWAACCSEESCIFLTVPTSFSREL